MSTPHRQSQKGTKLTQKEAKNILREYAAQYESLMHLEETDGKKVALHD